ncbi:MULTISPECIES: hemerythrin domain-containing protein [Streptomyces]|uniref:hemerythrin domain-containing protein n=1 Tax=Streptomyces TaxID=1883 RepID=UPI0031DA64F4
MGHGGDVIAELTTDHHEVEDFFQQIHGLLPGDPRRKDVADKLTIELVRHSVAEETYLYPAVRAYLPDGDSIADKELDDHAAAERIMKDLEGCDADDPRFDGLVDKLMTEIREHIAEEESILFPRLRGACSAEALDELGEKVRSAKRTAPTRPHPSVPDKPPANKILAPGVGLVDRLRDALSGRGKDS